VPATSLLLPQFPRIGLQGQGVSSGQRWRVGLHEGGAQAAASSSSSAGFVWSSSTRLDHAGVAVARHPHHRPTDGGASSHRH